MATTDTAKLKDDCLKALHCLYIAVEKSTADDVNRKVKAYVEELEMRCGIRTAIPGPNGKLGIA